MFTVSTPHDGLFQHPARAQARLVERVKKIGEGVVRYVWTDFGKRGRYTLTLCHWIGWDPEIEDMIEIGSPMPKGRAWVALLQTELTGQGGHSRTERTAPNVFVTHHALSRLAQRLGARTPMHLLISCRSFLEWRVRASEEHGEDGWLKLKPPTTGWHVPIPGVDGAAFVFQPHAKHKALIAVTVLSPPAVGTGQERDNLAT